MHPRLIGWVAKLVWCGVVYDGLGLLDAAVGVCVCVGVWVALMQLRELTESSMGAALLHVVGKCYMDKASAESNPVAGLGVSIRQVRPGYGAGYGLPVALLFSSSHQIWMRMISINHPVC